MNHTTIDRAKELKALRRRANRARKFPTNTCPASRHLHIMADCLLKPKKDGSLRYPMFEEEPEHCAESILAVIASLWETRSKNRADEFSEALIFYALARPEELQKDEGKRAMKALRWKVRPLIEETK